MLGVGQDFINTLLASSSLMNDVIDRKCNMEKLLTYQIVFLQTNPSSQNDVGCEETIQVATRFMEVGTA